MELNHVLIPTSSDHSSTTRVKTVAKCHIFQEEKKKKKTDDYVTIWYFVLMWKANSKWKHHYLPLDDEMMIGVLPIQQMERNWQKHQIVHQKQTPYVKHALHATKIKSHPNVWMAYFYEGYKWRIHVKKTTAAMTNKDIFHIRPLRNWVKIWASFYWCPLDSWLLVK